MQSMTKRKDDIMKCEPMTPSQIIKTFLDLVESAKADYNYNFESMRNEERITQDYLHMLELEGLNCRERSKIATKLVANRQTRRNYKDAVEELEPIVEFFDDPQNHATINRMSELLGQVRKIENYHQKRFYVPKVISSQNIKNNPSRDDMANAS